VNGCARRWSRGAEANHDRRTPLQPVRWLAVAILLSGCFIGSPLRADPAACGATGAVLVHPEVRGVYVDAVAQLVTGLERGGVDDLSVCTWADFEAMTAPERAARIFTLGDKVTAKLARIGDPATLIGLLVTRLRPGMPAGLSLFADPHPVIERIQVLQPAIRALHLVYLADVPADAVARVRSAARQAGLAWETTAVASVREAARAIERLKTDGDPTTAVWFHTGVLGLNPDVLIPPLVRIGWDRRLFVVADDAAYVERGVLMSVSADLEALGALAARAVTGGWSGLRDAAALRWGVNRRTAAALGVDGRLRLRPVPDFVYE